MNTPIKHKHKTWVDLLRPPLRRLRTYLVRPPFSSTKLFFLPSHSKSPRSTWQFFCHLPCKTNFLRKAFWTKGNDQQGYLPDHWLKPSPGSLVSLGIGLPRVGPRRLCLSFYPQVRRKLREILIISNSLGANFENVAQTAAKDSNELARFGGRQRGGSRVWQTNWVPKREMYRSGVKSIKVYQDSMMPSLTKEISHIGIDAWHTPISNSFSL